MNLIELTDATTNKPIAVNLDHVVSVQEGDGTTVLRDSSGHAYHISETYKETKNLIRQAMA